MLPHPQVTFTNVLQKLCAVCAIVPVMLVPTGSKALDMHCPLVFHDAPAYELEPLRPFGVIYVNLKYTNGINTNGCTYVLSNNHNKVSIINVVH